MGMTEKQGGSDVRANVTRAVATSVDGDYTLHGHKWFTSAPMNDVFLVLAQAGLTCFVVPRVLPDGSRNRLDVVRLKDKLGNRSNASGELELDGTLARRLGDEGRGVRTIIEMVAATRLDCVLGSTALMRRAVNEAAWHVAHRRAFGTLLADAPLMQNVIADLAVEAEAATALAVRLAAAVDGLADPQQAHHERALPIGPHLRERPAYAPGDGTNAREVGRPALALRRVHGDKDHLRLLHDRREVGREAQPSVPDTPLDKLFESRLVEGHPALPKLGDETGVLVHARHPVAYVCEACPRGKPHVPGSYDADVKFLGH